MQPSTSGWPARRSWRFIAAAILGVLALAACDHEEPADTASKPDDLSNSIRLSCSDASGDMAFMRVMAPIVEGLGAAIAPIPANAWQCGTNRDPDNLGDSWDLSCSPDLSVCESLTGSDRLVECYPEATAHILEISKARFSTAFNEYEDLVLCDSGLETKTDSEETASADSSTASSAPEVTTPPNPPSTATTPTGTPQPTPTPLPDTAVFDDRVPDGFGLKSQAGVLITILGTTEQSCDYRIVGGIKWDPAAIAYSYTQTFRGVTETLTFATDGTILSNNRSTAAERHQGQVWPDNEPASNYIGMRSFDDGRGSGFSTSGPASSCAALAEKAIERDEISVTNPIIWYPFEPLPTPTPTSAPVGESLTEDMALDLEAWAEAFWANPPVPVRQSIQRGLNDEPILTFLQGPDVDGQHIWISRAHFANDRINQVGIAEARFVPTRLCPGGCPDPSAVVFSLDIRKDTTSSQTETKTSVGFNPYSPGDDCTGCRLATTGDIDQFMNFVNQTIDQN